MATSHLDTGSKSMTVCYDLGPIRAGKTAKFHLQGEHLLAGAPFSDHDMMQPESLSVSVHADQPMGVSLHHDCDGLVPIATASRVINVDGRTGVASAFHHVSGADQKIDLTGVTEPGEAVLRRNRADWENMVPSNVTSGAFKVDHMKGDKLETSYVITPNVTDASLKNQSNALHRLISKNSGKSAFYGGKFAKDANTVEWNGTAGCFKLSDSEFQTMKSEMTDALTVTSNFQHGLRAQATNLGPEDSKNCRVFVTINRKENVAPVEGFGKLSIGPAGNAQAVDTEEARGLFKSAGDDSKFTVSAV